MKSLRIILLVTLLVSCSCGDRMESRRLRLRRSEAGVKEHLQEEDGGGRNYQEMNNGMFREVTDLDVLTKIIEMEMQTRKEKRSLLQMENKKAKRSLIEMLATQENSSEQYEESGTRSKRSKHIKKHFKKHFKKQLKNLKNLLKHGGKHGGPAGGAGAAAGAGAG